MLKIDILAHGRMKSASPLTKLWADYLRRMRWQVSLSEIEGQNPGNYAAKIAPGAFVIALDENGQDLDSRAFAERITTLAENGCKKVQFLIGGPDGLDPGLKRKADLSLRFGKLTWPHMLVRIMLIEQLYRAQQIQAGHPYHRD